MKSWYDLIFCLSKKKSRLRKRRLLYRSLNKIPIPKRNTEDLKAIDPLMYYVIWEKVLTKPKVFRYSFVSEYFAMVFCKRRLSQYPYNIMKGSDLIGFGITHARTKLRNVELDGSQEIHTRYTFPDGISKQNKKSMRTLYRRNLRRLLIKKDKQNG